jgi:hypothetical protein
LLGNIARWGFVFGKERYFSVGTCAAKNFGLKKSIQIKSNTS